MYMNANFARSWNRLVGKDLFQKTMPVYEATDILVGEIGHKKAREVILSSFPEKSHDIVTFDNGDYEEFFSETQHIRSTKLSPGYMGDCPHRLDGIHDYCTFCRKHNDPGRSDDNMRTYNHDRRAFMWWAEGDWKVADALYNSATSGTCINCGHTVKKISPDHVGPLSCGFQQNGFFEPLCGRCNSAKNRRFTFNNVIGLLDYEERTGESAASWQVRALWDSAKSKMRNDHTVKILSNYMRAMQDYYLRSLYYIASQGYYEFLTVYLHPEYANYTVAFTGLNTSTLSYERITKMEATTNGSRSLAARTIRIAFEELSEYCSKATAQRKSIILKTTDNYLDEDIPRIDALTSLYAHSTFDNVLSTLLAHAGSLDEKDSGIQKLIESPEFSNRYSTYDSMKIQFEALVSRRGTQLADKCIEEIS